MAILLSSRRFSSSFRAITTASRRSSSCSEEIITSLKTGDILCCYCCFYPAYTFRLSNKIKLAKHMHANVYTRTQNPLTCTHKHIHISKYDTYGRDKNYFLLIVYSCKQISINDTSLNHCSANLVHGLKSGFIFGLWVTKKELEYTIPLTPLPLLKK